MDSLVCPVQEEESSPWSPALSFCFWFGFAFLVIKSCICKRRKPHREAKTNMASSTIRAVEEILSYRFKDKSLLEEALTHSSYYNNNNNNGESFRSYQRLEFLGDMVLGLALSKYLYLKYPSLDPGHLSPLHDANISNEKLVRVAVRHHLDSYIRHNISDFQSEVKEFARAARAISQEDDKVLYGSIKAPNILADIVESLAGAIYVDLNFNLQKLWVIFENLLEPIVTLEDLQQQPEPVRTFFEQCQKQGRKPDIKRLSSGENNIVGAYVDDVLVALGSSDQMDIARRNAAKLALHELPNFMPTNITEVCDKKRWPNPIFSIEKQEGPPQGKKYALGANLGGVSMVGE